MSLIHLAIASCIATVYGAANPPASLPAASQPTTTKPAEAGRVVVTGQVFNHTGGGVEGATVTLVEKAAGSVVGTAVSNNYGDFRITAGETPKGPLTLTFAKPQYQTQTVELEPIDPAEPPFVDREMLGAIVLKGKLFDDRTKDPVAGASVVGSMGYKEWKAQSDEQGAFALEGLLPGPLEVRVEVAGYAKLQAIVRKVEAADSLDLALKPERIVRLLVTDESGQPIGQVDMECYDKANHDYRHLVTGADGKLTIRGLSADAVELPVRLTHEAYVSSVDFDRVIKFPEEGTESEHTLVMQRGGGIAGRVVQAEGGDPLPGARLCVGEVQTDVGPRAWSDFEGAYRIGAVPPGEAIVTIHLSGYAPELATVKVEAGQDATLDVKMSAARAVSGTVADESGKSLVGAQVNATKWRDHGTLGLRAMTDAEGRFEIVDAPRDAFEVAVYLPKYEPLLNQPVTPGTPAKFTLKPDKRAEGAALGSAFAVGDEAPALAVKTLSGESIKLADLKGKVVLLDFWATWCGPCVAEVPNLVDVYGAFGQREDLVMISVSLDDDEKKLRSFVEANKMKWRQVGGSGSGAQEAADAYKVTAIPSIIIIGADGKIAAGDARGPALKQKLAELLGK